MSKTQIRIIMATPWLLLFIVIYVLYFVETRRYTETYPVAQIYLTTEEFSSEPMLLCDLANGEQLRVTKDYYDHIPKTAETLKIGWCEIIPSNASPVYIKSNGPEKEECYRRIFVSDELFTQIRDIFADDTKLIYSEK